MIEYCVYIEDKNVMMGDKPFTWLEGRFTQECNAKLFLKALQKERPYKNVTYFMEKWDTEKNTFVK